MLFEVENLAPTIPGLSYHPSFITADEEGALIKQIDLQPWREDLKRRVQHYGYRYDYRARAVSKADYLGPLPLWAERVAAKLYQEGYFAMPPEQIIINEYLPGQGISKHIDCVPCFGAVIASLSLGSATVMQFSKGGESHHLYLESRSLVLLSGPARYEWTHAIPARKSDRPEGVRLERRRRLSLTFRSVIL